MRSYPPFTLRCRNAFTLALLAALPAMAEGQWLTSRGRIEPALRLEAFGGANTFGVGAVAPNDTARAAWSAELLYAFRDRVVEARGARVFQLNPSTSFAVASANVGTSLYAVAGPFNGGLGPNGGITLSLGGRTVSVDLSLQTGVDVFFAAPVFIRLPQRGGLGITVRVFDFTVSAMARAGADIVPGHQFVGRGDFVLSLGWLRPTQPR